MQNTSDGIVELANSGTGNSDSGTGNSGILTLGLGTLRLGTLTLTDRTLHGNGDWLTLARKRGYMSKHKNIVQAGLSDTVSLEQVSHYTSLYKSLKS